MTVQRNANLFPSQKLKTDAASTKRSLKYIAFIKSRQT